MSSSYPSELSRLVEYFKLSRDKWKARSHKYQAEKRALQTQVRDLRRSARGWKQKYEALKSSALEVGLDESEGKKK